MAAEFPLLAQQKGFLFHEHESEITSLYINHVVISFNEKICEKSLRRAIHSLVSKFPVLRSYVNIAQTHWVCKDKGIVDLECKNLLSTFQIPSE